MENDPASRSDESLRALFDEAHRAHGELATSYETFRARLTPLIIDGETVSAQRAGELYLVCACEAGEPAALAQFELHFMPAARAAIAHVTSNEDAIDEAVQELRRRLFVGDFPRIRSFSGRGPLWKWLRITATRTAHDLRRSRGLERWLAMMWSSTSFATTSTPNSAWSASATRGSFARRCARPWRR